MHIPSPFALENTAATHRLIEDYSFAVLCSADGDGMEATHLPFLLDRERRVLRAHMARANPHWNRLDAESQVLVIFSGAHSYVSPSWYAEKRSVPTWNYEAVHVYGRIRILDRAQSEILLRDMVEYYERARENRWTLPAGEDYASYFGQMTGAVVGMEISMDRVLAKSKLSQNRPVSDRASVIRELHDTASDLSQAVSRRMRDTLNEPG